MRNVPALTWREINAYFFSPLAYILMTLFLFFCGFFFYLGVRDGGEASMRGLLGLMGFFMMIAMPMITMRLIAEEMKSGTMETLMTAPVTDFEVVFAKFFGAFCFYLAMLAPTLLYVTILEWLGEPDYGPIWSGYIGIALMGGLFISIGLLASALTRNQIVAAVLALVALLLLWVIGFAAGFTEGWVSALLRYIGVYDHLDSFFKGMIDTRHIVYYVTMTGFCLFLCVRLVESRKWR